MVNIPGRGGGASYKWYDRNNNQRFLGVKIKVLVSLGAKEKNEENFENW